MPGHEVVADLDDGTRVVLEPVLGHAARGIAPPFAGAAPGDGNDYAQLASGHLEPGMQTGFCYSTGGGWARVSSPTPPSSTIGDDLTDEHAVIVEPPAGGIHAALMAARYAAVQAAADRSSPCSVPARWASPRSPASCATCRDAALVVGARYPHQQRLARESAPTRRRRRRAGPGRAAHVGCHVAGDQLTIGRPAVFDCVGTSASIEQALSSAARAARSSWSACPPR